MYGNASGPVQFTPRKNRVNNSFAIEMLNFQKAMAIGFLPLALVNLTTSPNTQGLIAAVPSIRRFINYFQRNWMIVYGVFRPSQWNVFNLLVECRTNNAVEAYNRAWNRFVDVRHPSLWTFLTKLKRRHEVKVINMANGLLAPRRKRK